MGRLLLTRAGQTELLLLMNQPVESATGVVYRQVASGVVSSSNVSFQGDMPKLATILETVVPEWSAWETFSGIAIHGLEELFLAP
jgi:hypothetical protein